MTAAQQLLGRRRATAVTGALLITAATLTACGDGDRSGSLTSASSPVSAAPTSTPASEPLDTAKCAEAPPTGDIDRRGEGLSFRNGIIRIALTPVTGSPAPPPGARPTAQTRCYEFTRWGPADPAVPPDSLLFVFRGEGTDGAQIEFGVSELTGGVLPPVRGVRPRVGPLTGPINAQIGISLRGIYHHGGACQLTLTAMAAGRAAGHFVCPAASLSDANPLAPDDDVPYDAGEDTPAPDAPAPDASVPPSPVPPPTTPTGPPTTATLTGWFELS